MMLQIYQKKLDLSKRLLDEYHAKEKPFLDNISKIFNGDQIVRILTGHCQKRRGVSAAAIPLPLYNISQQFVVTYSCLLASFRPSLLSYLLGDQSFSSFSLSYSGFELGRCDSEESCKAVFSMLSSRLSGNSVPKATVAEQPHTPKVSSV